MNLDQHDIATVTHAIIERVEKDMGPMNPMTMIGVREVIENHEYTSMHSCSDECVHVDWHMTPNEWSELRRVLNDVDIPYIQALKSAGNLPLIKPAKDQWSPEEKGEYGDMYQ